MPNEKPGLPLVPVLAVLTLLFPWLAFLLPEPATQLGSQPLGGHEAPVPNTSCTDEVLEGLPKDAPIETLIATVPDPLQTRLGYEFDRFVEAIERGAGASGYTLHRFCLPWLAWGSTDDAVSLESRIKRSKAEPGYMVFRREDATGRPHVLEVLLIGEMPTGGIATAALTRALKEVEKRRRGPPRDDKVRILGPSFSGSALSLATTLQDWLDGRSCPPTEIQMISGSATSVFPDELQLGGCGKFEAAVHPDAEVLDVVGKLLSGASEKGGAPQIGLLVENTGYGQAVHSAIRKRPTRKTLCEVPRADAPQDATEPAIMTLFFPLHVSSVRQAYEQRKAQSKTTREQDQTTDKVLPLVSEKSNARDVLPPFSELETNSVELILSGILTTIARERIKYVGIFATDVKDRLFLAEEVFAHCPNASVFTSDSDLIYGHSNALRGMFVYSTYPLFAMNQRWVYPYEGSPRRLQFASSNAQGVYNATVALLGHHEDKDHNHLVEYGTPFDFGSTPHQPPLWLSVVGQNGLWPVKVVSDSSSCYLHNAHDFVLPPPFKLTGVFSEMTIGVSVLGGFASGLVLLLLMRPLGQRLSRLQWITTLFSSFDFEAGPDAETWLSLLGCSGAAAILSGLMAAVFSCPARAAVDPHLFLGWWDRGFSGIPFVFFFVFFLALMTTALIALGGLYRACRSMPKTRRGAVIVSLAFLLLVVGSALYADCLLSLPANEAVFFFIRATDLANGVSPLTPLLLLGISNFFWSFSALRRVRLNAEVEGVRLLPSPDTGSLSGFDVLETNVRDGLTAPAFRVPGSRFVFLLVVPFGELFWVRFVAPLDETIFHVLARLWFILLYVSIALTFLRTVTIWSATHRLLRRLSMHPLADAFSRLPESLSWTPTMGVVRRVPTSTDIEASVRYARSLLGRGAESDALHVSFRDLLAGEAQRDREAARGKRKEIQRQLTDLAGQAAQELEPHWTRRGPKASPESERVAAAEEFLASRVVTFLHHVFAQLRNLLLFVSFGLILMLAVSTSYPFQPRQLLLTFQWTAILSVVTVVLGVFVQMDRDRVLSNIAHTPPGRVTWSRAFVTRVVTYVVLPILGLLHAQFPAGADQIGTWLRTLVGAH